MSDITKWEIKKGFALGTLVLCKNGSVVETIAFNYDEIQKSLFDIVFETAKAMGCLASKEQVLNNSTHNYYVLFNTNDPMFEYGAGSTNTNKKIIDNEVNASLITYFLNKNIKVIKEFLGIE